MPAIALLPGLALAVGASAAAALPLGPAVGWVLVPLVAAGWLAWWRRRARSTTLILATAFAVAGAGLGADARGRALRTPLRVVLDGHVGGFLGPFDLPPPHDPLLTRLQLDEDAALTADGVVLRARARAVWTDGGWTPVDGGVVVGVGGAEGGAGIAGWTAGRTLEAPVSFRRPARYLDPGVGDAERGRALDGVTLTGSVKSALLVGPPARAGPVHEAAAAFRRHVRARVGRYVGRHDVVAGGVVLAILIGDRSALPDAVRERLQAAGTYHVIAISGGNVAVLTGLCLLLLAGVGVRGRVAAATTLVVLTAYAGVVTAEPSVRRATLMAACYLGARLLDHRTGPWQALGLAAGLALCAAPLDVRAIGFVLTFGAALALIELARTTRRASRLPALLRWVAACALASLAVEVVLLPVFALAFGRVTLASVPLNLIAVPAMGVVQIAALGVAVLPGPEWLLAAAGHVASAAARTILESARLVEAWPWLVVPVPPPAWLLAGGYYTALGVARWGRGRLRRGGIAGVAACAALIVSGASSRWPGPPAGHLRLTMLDVGQGEAILVQAPDGPTLLVDAGGRPFGPGADIGARVVVPAARRLGVRRLDALVVTHPDPDHIGGAGAVLEALRPGAVWEGVPVVDHRARQDLLVRAAARGVPSGARVRGEVVDLGRATARVLHPPPPEWRRPRVRNDDSIVLEILFGDVAILLTGDISAEVEREILPMLTPAPIRVLKAAHHGSRTSTGPALVQGWRPHIVLVSAGRGNTFGHPTPEVLGRLAGIGARVYRTDRDGAITLDTDGRGVTVSTLAERLTTGVP